MAGTSGVGLKSGCDGNCGAFCAPLRCGGSNRKAAAAISSVAKKRRANRRSIAVLLHRGRTNHTREQSAQFSAPCSHVLISVRSAGHRFSSPALLMFREVFLNISRMLRFTCFPLLVCASSLLSAAGIDSARASAALAQVPLRFEANQGRMDPSVEYAARGAGFNLLLTKAGPVMTSPDSHRIDVTLLNSRPASAIEPLSRLSTRTDSFIGRRENW